MGCKHSGPRHESNVQELPQDGNTTLDAHKTPPVPGTPVPGTPVPRSRSPSRLSESLGMRISIRSSTESLRSSTRRSSISRPMYSKQVDIYNYKLSTYPMRLLKKDVFMERNSIPLSSDIDSQIFLDLGEILITKKRKKYFIVFISHRWWYGKVDDDKGHKFGILKVALEKLEEELKDLQNAGSSSREPQSMFEGEEEVQILLWMDCFSIEDGDEHRFEATASLPSYIANSDALLTPYTDKMAQYETHQLDKEKDAKQKPQTRVSRAREDLSISQRHKFGNGSESSKREEDSEKNFQPNEEIVSNSQQAVKFDIGVSSRTDNPMGAPSLGNLVNGDSKSGNDASSERFFREPSRSRATSTPMEKPKDWEDYQTLSEDANEYFGRAWCRLEIFLALNAPLPENGFGYIEKKQIKWKNIPRQGRPHFLCGDYKDNELMVMPPLVRLLSPAYGAVTQKMDENGWVIQDDYEVIKQVYEAAQHRLTCKQGYVGERKFTSLQRGKKHGQGVERYVGGAQYDGNWKNGIRDGQGTLTLANGDRFEGIWLKDQMSEGKFIWADGAVYEGQFQNNHRHGDGILTISNNAGSPKEGSGKIQKYEGQWEEGKKHGAGHLVYFNGDEFTGLFEHDLKHGLGEFIWNDGHRYLGQWEKGKRRGKGKMTWPDDAKYRTKEYQGEWLKNKPHGEGRIKYTNGNLYFGFFKNGQKDGKGLYIWLPDDRNFDFFKGLETPRRRRSVSQGSVDSAKKPNKTSFLFGNWKKMGRARSSKASLKSVGSRGSHASMGSIKSVSSMATDKSIEEGVELFDEYLDTHWETIDEAKEILRSFSKKITLESFEGEYRNDRQYKGVYTFEYRAGMQDKDGDEIPRSFEGTYSEADFREREGVLYYKHAKGEGYGDRYKGKFKSMVEDYQLEWDPIAAFAKTGSGHFWKYLGYRFEEENENGEWKEKTDHSTFKTSKEEHKKYKEEEEEIDGITEDMEEEKGENQQLTVLIPNDPVKKVPKRKQRRVHVWRIDSQEWEDGKQKVI